MHIITDKQDKVVQLTEMLVVQAEKRDEKVDSPAVNKMLDMFMNKR